MITPPAWYQPIENWLAPSYPIMIALALVLGIITVYLIWKHNPLILAAWLTYLIMP